MKNKKLKTILIIVALIIVSAVPISAFIVERNYMPKNKYQIMQIESMMKLEEVKYLVIHETANENVGANANAHMRRAHSDNKESVLGTQIYIDNTSAIQVAPFDTMLWHTGEPTGDRNINNYNSIGIEMCVDSKVDEHGNVSEELTKQAREQTYSNTIKYIQEIILPQYPEIEIVMHHHVWGKNCPRYMLEDNRWEEFLNRVYNPENWGETTTIDEVILVNSENTFDEYFASQDKEVLENIISELKSEIDNSLNIMGYEEIDLKKVEQFILNYNPNPKLNCTLSEWLEIVDYASKMENINPIVPITQSLLETKYFEFTGIVVPEQNNYSGHGATGFILEDGSVDSGTWFDTPRDGIYAQIVHLLGYASTNDSVLGEHYSNRFYLLENKRGSCPTIYSLARNYEGDPNFWAYDMAYGKKIENIIENLNMYSYYEDIDENIEISEIISTGYEDIVILTDVNDLNNGNLYDFEFIIINFNNDFEKIY